jgi:hypothetical protein
VQLQSKKQKPLQRYFPELEAGLLSVAEDGFVLDGEIVIPGQSFDVLQLRLHPAASRIAKLAFSELKHGRPTSGPHEVLQLRPPLGERLAQHGPAIAREQVEHDNPGGLLLRH